MSALQPKPPPGFRERAPHGGFHQLIGPFYIKGDGTDRCYGFRTLARHTNPANVVHGGLLMTVMDMVLTSTVTQVTEGKNHVSTVSMNCDFLTPVSANSWIDGSGEVIRLTRSIAFVRGCLKVDGVDAVRATGVWRVFSAPAKSRE
jgi:uncharacterized protein (TIGR00369 family)